MPESLTRRENAAHIRCGCPASCRNDVRLHVGMVSGFTSERCPPSCRNGVRLHIGIVSGIVSERLAGIARNLQRMR